MREEGKEEGKEGEEGGGRRRETTRTANERTEGIGSELSLRMPI